MATKPRAVRRLPKSRNSFNDPRTIGFQLRKSIDRHPDLTPYQIGDKARVDRSVIGRFVNGERDVTLDVAERLAIALGLRLTTAAKRKAVASDDPNPEPEPTPEPGAG